MSGYDAVMQVAAREDGDRWLAVAWACHMTVMHIASQTGDAPAEVEFAPEMELKTSRFKWLGGWRREDPGLTPLCDAGVLARVREPHDREPDVFFRMPDPDGVGRALDELQVRGTLIATRRIMGKRL